MPTMGWNRRIWPNLQLLVLKLVFECQDHARLKDVIEGRQKAFFDFGL